MNPFRLFPIELWEMMYNHMEKPKNKLKFMRAHPKFYNLFGGIEKENELLFASALPIIVTHFDRSGRKMNNQERKVRREMVLACRLVSSSSWIAIDKWLEKYWKKSTEDYPIPSFLHVRDEEEVNYFSRTALDKFTQDFQNDPCETRNPLLSRFATFPISIWGTEVEEALYRGDFGIVEAQVLEDDEKRVAVLRKIGPHMRKLQVDFGVEYTLNQGVWLAKLSSLRHVLELTSNIRSLVLTFLGLAAGPRLRNNQFSLPALPHLDHLKVTGGWRTPQKDILASIRVYFPGLKELEFRDAVDFQDNFLGDAGLFSELKLLKITTFSQSLGFTETINN